MKEIIVTNARSNNLKNISVKLPRNKLISITGPSGSGKSSLAFDTIFKEGQRRYLESLTSFGKTYLQSIERPKVDSIEGLSPTIALDQKTIINNPRSTVGTITEIYNYLRMLYAKLGTAHSPATGKPISPQDKSEIIKKVLNYKKGTKLTILSPILVHKKGVHKNILTKYESMGFSKIRVNKKIQFIDEPLKINPKQFNHIDLVIDRIILKDDSQKRIEDSIQKAFQFSKGTLIVLKNEEENFYSSKYFCADTNQSFPSLDESLFSFNSPRGFCQTCQGLGTQEQITEQSVFFDKTSSIKDGPLGPLLLKEKTLKATIDSIYGSTDLETPINKLPKSIYKKLIEGDGYFKGLIYFLNSYRLAKNDRVIEDNLSHIIVKSDCLDCHGKRLAPYPLNVLINGKSISDACALSIDEFQEFIAQCLKEFKNNEVGEKILVEIKERVHFLMKIGLSYLSLSRRANTLSGGEFQRIRLSSQLGSMMSGLVYILDEPSIGLHQRDNEKLIDSLISLKERNNTVIVVEHDEETMQKSDHIIDIGPGSGIDGGLVVSEGSLSKIKKCKESVTGQYLSGKKTISLQSNRSQKEFLKLKGAKAFNIKNLNVDFPLHNFICLTGVSGSGKSTLIHKILIPALKSKLSKRYPNLGNFKSLEGDKLIDDIISIDQKPIGRTPKSIPLTYCGIFSRIRDIFANTNEAKTLGLKIGDFSFNVKSGQCKTCEGNGKIKFEMPFLSNVYNTCPSCKGKRYSQKVLKVRYRDLNISDVLNLTVDQGLEFFKNHKKINFTLQTLKDVGLGYLRLGQSSTTLSGGEAQRVKLSRELSKMKKGHCFYVLDEPTTGLHFQDIQLLLDSISKLVDQGNTVIVIEHNLDVIKCADYIIDLGPDGGRFGGELIAHGKPKDILKSKKSITAKFLKKHLKGV